MSKLRIMSMMDEKQCIAEIVSGDSERYRELVERYQTGLIIHCENILKNRQEGEDAAQEAFIKAYRNITDFSPDKANFSTWLYRIATNICIDSLRKNKRKVDVKDIEKHLEAILPKHVEQEDIDHIRTLVKQLEPPKYAAIIKAYFWEGKSYQEMADTYGTTTGTIGTWMSRAKLQLKEKLV
jgi:RNA polymerase sigma-70 factor, ECF subfamily